MNVKANSLEGWRRPCEKLRIVYRILVIIGISKMCGVGCNSTYSSHKTEEYSRIPWNILLDPSYTSHKISASAATNQVVYSPPHYGQPSVAHRIISGTSPTTYRPHVHYVSPSPTSTSYASPTYPIIKTKYSMPIPNFSNSHAHNSIHKFNDHIKYNDYRNGEMFHNYNKHPADGSASVNFPGKVNIGNYVYEVEPPSHSSIKSSTPYKKTGYKSKQRYKKRRPDFNDDDYFQDLDDSYNDYDYPKRPPSRDAQHKYTSSSSNSYGILPSSSDSNGMFTNAKDLLKGNSYKKHSSSSSSSYSVDNYLPEPSPPGNLYYDYNDPYTYYGPDDETNAKYPKPDFFSFPHEFDYDLGEKYIPPPPLPPIHYPDKKKKYSTLAFALGLLPLGLLLASLVPTVVTIPVTTAVATGRRKRRSLRFVNPVLDTIEQYGVTSLEDPMCLQRVFCNVVIQGKENKSSVIQKLYYRVANLMTEDWADNLGLKLLLRAVRGNQCEFFPCNPQAYTSTTVETTKQALD